MDDGQTDRQTYTGPQRIPRYGRHAVKYRPNILQPKRVDSSMADHCAHLQKFTYLLTNLLFVSETDRRRRII